MSSEAERSTSRLRFPEISPRAYEHPADRGALATLRAVPGFPAVLKAVSGAVGERSERLLALASHVKVGGLQYPELQELRVECGAILDIDPVPEIFVARDPQPQAKTIGMDKPFIVITTGLVELLDTDGLRFAIGHEMGHALSGHAMYRTLLDRLLGMVVGLSWMPVGYWGLRAIIIALQDWYRRSELSCDRAGLLCAQDPAVVLRTHMMMAGATDPDKIDTAAFLSQAKEYDEVPNVWDSVLKLMHLNGRLHPLPVMRAAELQRWAAGEGYRAILAGDYPRRGDDPESSWKDDVRDAAKSYRESLSRSADPLAKVINEVGDAVSATASKIWQRFGGQPGAEAPADTDGTTSDSKGTASDSKGPGSDGKGTASDGEGTGSGEAG